MPVTFKIPTAESLQTIPQIANWLILAEYLVVPFCIR